MATKPTRPKKKYRVGSKLVISKKSPLSLGRQFHYKKGTEVTVIPNTSGTQCYLDQFPGENWYEVTDGELIQSVPESHLAKRKKSPKKK